MVATADERLKDVLLPSEVIEPLFARAIGVLFQEWQDHSKQDVEAGVRFLRGLRFLCFLSSVNGAPHAGIVMTNEISRVSAYLENKLGVSRSELWKKSDR